MPWSARPVLIYRPGSDASGVWERHISPAWDYTQPTPADIQVDGWWRCRSLSPYTNMCSPLYWMTFFRHGFLSETGMQRKMIACSHKTETDRELLMGQLQGQVSQIKCTQANKTGKTCDDCRGIAASFVYIKCLYLQMRIHDSAAKLLYWNHWKKKTWNSHLCFLKLWYFMMNQTFSILPLFNLLLSRFVTEAEAELLFNEAQKLSDPKYLWALKSSAGRLPVIPNYFHIHVSTLAYLSCNKSFLHLSDLSCSSWLFKGRMSSVVSKLYDLWPSQALIQIALFFIICYCNVDVLSIKPLMSFLYCFHFVDCFKEHW